ncbi:fibronectin type 3 domain-containing protein [Metabacillus crassostreae]|uniref:OmpL47-type beta-barrel domain-containing protein n=1 Tax=Metabacillus crassostreae TaxID=929098 RepID=UPI001956A5E1|nr:hypothetical protein [Metabacillus crassostreae]MBM7606229.1 fibronectin type 3 domain-containing protein [Metabacillus crassostreae]
MRNLFRLKPLLIALVLLSYQVIVPIGSVFATSANMLPPSNLAVEKVTPDDVKLTWSAVYGASAYKVYEIKDGQILPLGEVKSNSYTANDLEEGSYEYVVSTLSSEGESGPSAPVAVMIEYPEMTAPATFTHTINNGNDIVLSWSPSQYVEKYNVFQISSDGEKSLLTSVTNTTHTVSNAPEGNYSYAVSAVNSLYGESSLSDQLDVTVVHPTMTAPENFTYSVTNGNDVTLKWNTVSFADNYKVYQVIDGEKILKETVTSTSLKLTNAPAGEYMYEVHSNSNRFGESEKGSQLNVTVDSITMATPNVTYKLQNINDITLTWGSVSYANSYKIYQIIDGEKVLQNTVTGTSITFKNMPGGNYTYEVYSYSDRFGESNEGGKVSLQVETVTMAVPENFKYEIQNGNDIVLSWDSAANADSYKIYQVIDGQKVLKSTASGTAVRYSNLPEGNYSYEVHSYSNRFGESKESSKQSITLVHPTMEPPANVKKTIKSASSFTISWDSAPYATNYKVYQVVDGNEVLKSTVTGTAVSYSNIAPGNYTYVVYANSSRFGQSVSGSKVTLTLTGLTMEAPTDLSHTITNGNDITLKWTGVQNANGYNIYQVIDGESVLQKTVTGTSVKFTNMPADNYQYEITSFSNLYGESEGNAKAEISLVHPTMEAPTDFTYTVKNGNDVVLSWKSVEYANTYNVYEMIDGEKKLVKSVSSLSTSIVSVAEGDHTYIVHSESSRFGESANSGEVSLAMVHPTMKAPGNVSQTILNGNDILLKWDASEYATAYNVYQIIGGELVLAKTVTSTSVRFNNMPDSEYSYVIHSDSTRFGESVEGSNQSFSLVHPTMQAPANLSETIVNGNDIRLKWDASDYATSYNVYQIIDSERVLQKTVTGTSFTFVNMPEGDYTYEIRAESNRFGESANGSDLSLNLIHPIMQAPENLTQSIANGNDIVLKWNASTYATEYRVYQIVDEQLVLKASVKGTTARFNNMTEGDYEYVVHSYSNRFDESPNGSSTNFTLTWPVVEAPVISAKVENINNIMLSWPAAAWANEYRVYQITNDERTLIYKGTARSYKANNLSEDTHSFEVTAYNTRFGESKASNRITETIVYPIMEPPTASLTLVSETSARINWNFITYANGYNIYEVIDGELVLIAEKVNNLMYALLNLSYANHEYVVTSYSNSFGESKPSNVVLAKLILDEEAPVTTANAPTDWINEDQVITLSATDNETGVAKTYYSVDGSDFEEGTSFEVKGEGVHNVSFYSVDKVDNTEKVHTIEVKIDKTAPVTTSDAQDFWNNKDVTVNLTAEDGKSGVAKTFYAINGSEYVEGTSFIIEKEGLNLVTFYSVDNAGNKEVARTIGVKVDKTAPETTSDAPQTWRTDDVTVNLASTDELSGVTETFYSINGSDYVKGTAFTITEEGIHEVKFFSMDHSMNIEKIKTIEVKIDKTAPVVNMDLEAEYKLGTNLDLIYSAVDNISDVVTEKMIVSYPDHNDGKEIENGTSISLEKPGTYNLTVFTTNAAGLTTIIEKQFVVYIPAIIDVTAKVIKANKGVFTVRVDLPKGFDTKGFDLDSATVNGVNALTSNKGYYNQAKNGQFKFERSDFTWDSSEETLVFRGYLDGYLVVGQKTVRVQK